MCTVIKKEEPTIKKYNKSNLVYNSKYSFWKYYRDGEKIDTISFRPRNSFLKEFFNDLSKSNKLKRHIEETQKKKKQICLIQLQNYIMIVLKPIMTNTINFQTLKKESWIINAILKFYFLIIIIIACGQKMKKNLKIYHQFHL